ncbi:hypothetical protein QBC39DRAFT_334285 [Podospora conica]|nr:hypothetical protein QBC39DRAFT_334285 [Schizothecium conicum]
MDEATNVAIGRGDVAQMHRRSLNLRSQLGIAETRTKAGAQRHPTELSGKHHTSGVKTTPQSDGQAGQTAASRYPPGRNPSEEEAGAGQGFFRSTVFVVRLGLDSAIVVGGGGDIAERLYKGPEQRREQNRQGLEQSRGIHVVAGILRALDEKICDTAKKKAKERSASSARSSKKKSSHNAVEPPGTSEGGVGAVATVRKATVQLFFRMYLPSPEEGGRRSRRRRALREAGHDAVEFVESPCCLATRELGFGHRDGVEAVEKVKGLADMMVVAGGNERLDGSVWSLPVSGSSGCSRADVYQATPERTKGGGSWSWLWCTFSVQGGRKARQSTEKPLTGEKKALVQDKMLRLVTVSCFVEGDGQKEMHTSGGTLSPGPRSTSPDSATRIATKTVLEDLKVDLVLLGNGAHVLLEHHLQLGGRVQRVLDTAQSQVEDVVLDLVMLKRDSSWSVFWRLAMPHAGRSDDQPGPFNYMGQPMNQFRSLSRRPGITSSSSGRRSDHRTNEEREDGRNCRDRW